MKAKRIIAAGENTAAMAYIKVRRGLSLRQMKVILLVSILVVAILVGAWASGSWPAAILSTEFAIFGLGMGLPIIRALSGPSMRKALAKRGIAYEHPLTLRLTHEALVYDLAV